MSPKKSKDSNSDKTLAKPRPDTFKPYPTLTPPSKEDIDMIRMAIAMGDNPLPCIPYGAMHPGLTDQDIIDLVDINDRLYPSHLIDDQLV